MRQADGEADEDTNGNSNDPRDAVPGVPGGLTDLRSEQWTTRKGHSDAKIGKPPSLVSQKEWEAREPAELPKSRMYSLSNLRSKMKRTWVCLAEQAGMPCAIRNLRHTLPSLMSSSPVPSRRQPVSRKRLCPWCRYGYLDKGRMEDGGWRTPILAWSYPIVCDCTRVEARNPADASIKYRRTYLGYLALRR